MTFLDEISQQPDALKTFVAKYFEENNRSVEEFRNMLQRNKFKQVIFTGMGSSLFASYIACNYLRGKGIKAFVLESNELSSYDKAAVCEDTLLIAVSQSGESEEVIKYCEGIEEDNNIIIVTNYPSSRLYKYGHLKFEIFAGDEYTTATKSYTNTIAALVYIAYVIADANDHEFGKLKENLLKASEVMANVLNTQDSEIEALCDFIQSCTHILAVGSGASYCTASHAELVFEEAAKVYSSRYTTGQFIHGPIELINNKFCAAIFDFDEKMRSNVDRVVKAITEYEGKALVLTNRDIQIKHKNLFVFKMNYPDALTSPLVEILPIELAVNKLGLRKGHKPGILTRVVK